MEDMKIHSMKHTLKFHNIPVKQNKDCYTVINCFLLEILKVPDSLLFSKNNLSGEVRVDIAHRIGERKAKPRPLVVSFVRRRGRDNVFSFAKRTQLQNSFSHLSASEVQHKYHDSSSCRPCASSFLSAL